MEDRDDIELLEAWRDGDTAAGDALLRRHFTEIHRYLRASVPEKAAEELTQCTFEAIVAGRDRLRDPEKFRGYLFGIARKQLLRHIEANKRDGQVISPSKAHLPDPRTTPSRAVARRQELQALAEVLQQLSDDHRDVLERFYLDDQSLEQIASAQGVAVGTVKSRLFRAKEVARRLIESLDITSAQRDRAIEQLEHSRDIAPDD